MIKFYKKARKAFCGLKPHFFLFGPIFLMFVLCSATSLGQQGGITVSGTVKGTNNETLPGVSVSLKGTTTGTTTDVKGVFTLKVPNSQGSLVFSYLGYTTLEMPISGRKMLSVTLKEEQKNLNEVVVIGYGTVKKRDLTGSVASFKGDDLTQVPAANVMESLQGKVPGADITRSSGQAGAGVSITLRGNRSILGSNSPLYIVDGVIYYGNIADIDQNEIASVDVLKDASSTAIYGSRGANGVIIITTKRGAAGKTEVDANSYNGVSQASMYPKVATGPEMVALRREAYRASGKWTSPANDNLVFSPYELTAIANGLYTNWQDLVLHRGSQEDHQVGVSSGSEKTKMYTSLDYYRENGLFKNDNLTRYSGRINLDHTVSDKLKIGMQAQIVYSSQNVRTDPLNQANKINPIGEAFNPDGSIVMYPTQASAINPLADEQPGVWADNVKGNRTFAAAYAELTPIKGLSIRSNLSANLTNSRTGIYAGSFTITRNGGVPRANYNTSNGTDLLWENIVNYHKQIGQHTFDLTGIASYQDRSNESGSMQGDNQLLSSQLFYNLSAATQGVAVATGYTKQDIVSGAGRINYSYQGKYLLTLTGRSDGSSKLAEGHKWTFFPSAAAAWRLSEEDFIKKIKPINDLKLRASYGVAGNDPYDAYATQSLLTNVPFSYGETPAQGYTFNPTIGNRDLAWERSTTLDIGVDFALLNSRISGTVDVYSTHTNDLLLPRGLPPSDGILKTNQNIGQTANKGIELSISSVNIKSSNFSWNTSVTFTKNVEKITSLVNAGVNDIGNGWFVGYPVQVFYDYQKIGIWQTSEAAEAAKYGQIPGTIKVKDQNGDGKIDATNDRTVLGTPRPKWSGGLSNTVKYKNLDFSIYIYARIGQMINANSLNFSDNQGLQGNTWASNLDYWTPENPTNAYPRPNSNGGMQYVSTLAYTDGSYARIRDISLGYTLPQKLTGNVFKRLRVYVSGKNLFTWSKLKNYDPERGGSENFPMTKLALAGINATF